MTEQIEQKRLVGVLAAHDSKRKNDSLASVFRILYKINSEWLKKFHFVFTGGTFDRIVLPTDVGRTKVDEKEFIPIARKDEQDEEIPKDLEELMKKERKYGVSVDSALGAQNAIMCNSTRLPKFREGGVTLLSYLVVQQKISIVMPFLDPHTTHWLHPENLALMRLCDFWKAKRLMNTGSVEKWFVNEAETDSKQNREYCPPDLVLNSSGARALREDHGNCKEIKITKVLNRPTEWPRSIDEIGEMTIALIAHDGMKEEMVDFVKKYRRVLERFNRILATGDTGRKVKEAAGELKVFPYRPGPEGGDIQIATEALYDQCHAVIFFTNPLRPHPHPEDIRTLFAVCMIQDKIEILANDIHARRWMDRLAEKLGIRL